MSAGVTQTTLRAGREGRPGAAVVHGRPGSRVRIGDPLATFRRMSETVDLRGVATAYDEAGSGAPLVYLHGGFSDARELDPLFERYADHFRVYAPDRRGHGRTPDVAGAFGYAQFADDTIAFLETVVVQPAHLVGFSVGATTALLVALQRPDLVRRVVLISGQFHRDGLVGEFLGDDPVAGAKQMAGSPLAEQYADVSPDGADQFVVVAEKVIRMALDEPTLTTDDVARVQARALVVCSDDDAVSLEHTTALYRALPDAELAVIPGTSHVLILEKPDLVGSMILDFLTREPIPTRAPIRRR